MSDFQTVRAKECKDREADLRYRVSTNRLTDRDVCDIQNHGDRRTKGMLNKLAEKGWQEKAQLDRKHGKGNFDFQDGKGNLVKDIKLNIL